MKRGLILLFFAIVATTYEVTGRDICSLPKVVGPCKGAIPRWYYNVKKGTCEKFIYGGCGANKNNFLTKCDCQQRCGNNKDICCQRKKIGPCLGAIPRWYYNSTNDACQRFTYGGCKGNQNNFLTKCCCQNRCGGKKDICCLPKKKGPCNAAIRRWYYNSKLDKCQQFTFGGCKGNQNNFLTKCDCQNRCGNVKDICCLPKKRGPCHGAFPRWYYNSKIDACQLFTYGGCQGNQNNFQKKWQCEKRCF